MHAWFEIEALNDDLKDGDETVEIGADAPGYEGWPDSVVVEDID